MALYNYVRGLEFNVYNVVTDVESSIKKCLRRINCLMKLKDREAMDAEELHLLDTTSGKLQSWNENMRVLNIRKILQNENPGKLNIPLWQYLVQLQETKVSMEKIRSDLMDITLSLDQYEISFPRCYLPIRNLDESFIEYVDILRENIKVMWGEAGSRKRDQGGRTLIEWMLKRERSNRNVFKMLKTCIVDLGVEISKHLAKFLLILAVSSKKEYVSVFLFEIEGVLRCLSLKKQSVIIDTFISVLKFLGDTMGTVTISNKAKVLKGKEEESCCKETHVLIFRLIAMEILRLEIEFCFPHMPRTMSYEGFLSTPTLMVDEKVFKDNLDGLSAQIYGLQLNLICMGHAVSSTDDFLDQVFVGIKELWNKLELNQGAADEE